MKIKRCIMYKFNRSEYEKELEEYYSTYKECDHRVPLFCEIEKEWKEGIKNLPYPEDQKSLLYTLERKLPVHVFQGGQK